MKNYKYISKERASEIMKMVDVCKTHDGNCNYCPLDQTEDCICLDCIDHTKCEACYKASMFTLPPIES